MDFCFADTTCSTCLTLLFEKNIGLRPKLGNTYYHIILAKFDVNLCNLSFSVVFFFFFVSSSCVSCCQFSGLFRRFSLPFIHFWTRAEEKQKIRYFRKFPKSNRKIVESGKIGTPKKITFECGILFGINQFKNL